MCGEAEPQVYVNTKRSDICKMGVSKEKREIVQKIF